MPNIITDLKDVRISQAALMPWMTALLPLSAFSTNFSPEAADKLDTVKVPVIGMPSASSDFAGDYTANADSQASSVPYGQSLLKLRAQFALGGVRRGLEGNIRAMKRKLLRSLK